MLHAVIMAGGTGTRFWPESRAGRPKQLLTMVGQSTMIRATVDRLGELVPPQRVIVATTAQLAGKIAEELPELPREAILAEPCKRNTAPCIGLAALSVNRHDPDATMAVMPADHVIGPDESFQEAIRFAAALVDEQAQRIVTFGIRPSYPAESFGYIERGEPLALGPLGDCSDFREPKMGLSPSGTPPVYLVKQFREKPDAKTAAEYLESGRFYWNSGIFVWKAQTILDALAEYQPEMYGHLQAIADAADTPQFAQVLSSEFAAIKGISIDYAVMEHATDVLMIEAPFDWDDLGSWQSLARLRGADERGNTIAAKHLGLSTEGTIVRGGDDHLIVTLGLSDCIIVHTPDATLVANKHDEESIRQVVELL
ncbi:MAG: mannose-1-phosphate guanylyltransferase, partial [Planctomycetota bacterium]